MAIVMTHSAKGSANMYGIETRMYEAGEYLVTDAPCQQALAVNFIAAGLARDTKTVQPTETKQATPERARNADGTLIGDDPTTPDVNEAWKGGKSPKKSKK